MTRPGVCLRWQEVRGDGLAFSCECGGEGCPLDPRRRAGDVGMPGVWWCWLCNTRGCAVPWGPPTTELIFAHLNDAHPRIRPPEEPTLPSPLHPERHEYFERDPDPAGLPAAQIAVEHLRHHGQELLWDGTSHPAGLYDVYHRFVCAERPNGCKFQWTIMLHECDEAEPVEVQRPLVETAGHTPPDESADFGTLANHFCVMCGERVGGPHAVDGPNPPSAPPVPAAEPTPPPEPETRTMAAVGATKPPVRRPTPTPRKARHQ